MDTYIKIKSLDSGPEDLNSYLPLEAKLLLKMDSVDKSDYWIAKLKNTIKVKTRLGEKNITHLIVGARFLGESLKPRLNEYGINIAYVIDGSLLNDRVIDFNKGEYIAIGFANIFAQDEGIRKAWWKIWE